MNENAGVGSTAGAALVSVFPSINLKEVKILLVSQLTCLLHGGWVDDGCVHNTGQKEKDNVRVAWFHR